MKVIESLLTGDLPPREAFWTWLIARGLTINLACTFASLVLVATAAEDATWPLWLAAALHLAAVPYNTIAVIGVWRSVERAAPAPAEATNLRLASLAVFLVYLVL